MCEGDDPDGEELTYAEPPRLDHPPCFPVLIGLIGLFLLLRQDRRERRKEADSRLEKIERRLQTLGDQLFYITGRLDQQHGRNYQAVVSQPAQVNPPGNSVL